MSSTTNAIMLSPIRINFKQDYCPYNSAKKIKKAKDSYNNSIQGVKPPKKTVVLEIKELNTYISDLYVPVCSCPVIL